jgi:hypothetical protein
MLIRQMNRKPHNVWLLTMQAELVESAAAFRS